MAAAALPATPSEVHRRFVEGFNAGDADAILALYEPEATLVVQPGHPPARGLDQIREALGGFLALGGRMRLEHRQVLEAGGVALLVSDWSLAGTGPDGQPVTLGGTTIDVVRRQPDGGWRVVIDNPWGVA